MGQVLWHSRYLTHQSPALVPSKITSIK
jgi:hypothetical protein